MTKRGGKPLTPVNLSAARRLAALPVRAHHTPEQIGELARELRKEADQRRDELAARWSYKNEGTPETHERIHVVPERRRQGALARMARLGKISADELADAHEIASIIEMIEGQVGVRCASLEARVDYAGSGRDTLVESLGRVRTEVAYSIWRERLPEPKRLVIDLLIGAEGYVDLARRHGMHWRTARKRMMTAVRIWSSIKIAVRHQIGADDVTELYARIGEGTLRPPRPRNPIPTIAEDDAA